MVHLTQSPESCVMSVFLPHLCDAARHPGIFPLVFHLPFSHKIFQLSLKFSSMFLLITCTKNCDCLHVIFSNQFTVFVKTACFSVCPWYSYCIFLRNDISTSGVLQGALYWPYPFNLMVLQSVCILLLAIPLYRHSEYWSGPMLNWFSPQPFH